MRQRLLGLFPAQKAAQLGPTVSILPVQDQKVVGTAGDTAEAFKQISKLKPDVALLDLSMPGGGVLGMIRRLRGEVPGVKVLVLTMFDSPAYVHEAVTAGALGYLLKEAPGEEVVRAVRSVAAGQGYLMTAVTLPVLRKLAEDGFSKDDVRQFLYDNMLIDGSWLEKFGPQVSAKKFEWRDLVNRGKAPAEYAEAGEIPGFKVRQLLYPEWTDIAVAGHAGRNRR